MAKNKLIHQLFWILLCVLFTVMEAVAGAEIAVIVNKENPVQSLTSREISDIYLGRRRTFPSGGLVLVLEQKRNSSLRKDFFRLLNGMTLRRLNAYWARLQFSGEVQPPPVMRNSMVMLRVVQNNIAAIGYLDAALVDDSVRVILRLKD